MTRPGRVVWYRDYASNVQVGDLIMVEGKKCEVKDLKWGERGTMLVGEGWTKYYQRHEFILIGTYVDN
jgi:cobyric acid synthase